MQIKTEGLCFTGIDALSQLKQGNFALTNRESAPSVTDMASGITNNQTISSPFADKAIAKSVEEIKDAGKEIEYCKSNFASITVFAETGNAFVLIKPQFECENKNIGKSGIVKPSAHVEIVKKVVSFAIEEGLYPHAIVNAPVRKGKNIEYIVWLKKVAQGGLNILKIESAVKAFIKLNSEGLLT